MKIEEILEIQTMQLDETGYSRLVSHVNNRYIGIISASRGDVRPDINDANSSQLRADIRDAGFGFINVLGRYIEDEGTPKQKTVIERSYLIIGQNKDDSGNMIGFLKKEGRKFMQESVLYKPFDSKDAWLIYMNDSPAKNVGLFHPKQIGDYYSAVKGKAFSFSSLNEQRGWLGQWGASLAYGETK